MAERNGSIITCDRCGAQAFGAAVLESGVGVHRYPDGWRTKEHVMGRGFKDLCPECSRELLELTEGWWIDGREA